MIGIILGVLSVIQPVQAQGCPMLYDEWNGNCYRVFTNMVNYGDADYNCRTNVLGGHLASVHSNEENTYIYSKINDDTWIGFDDLAKENEFFWTDGSLNTFTNWAPGEPSNSINEDCTIMYGAGNYGSRWNNGYCSTRHQYVCKVPQSTSSAGTQE